jgi:hypothetical protein
MCYDVYQSNVPINNIYALLLLHNTPYGLGAAARYLLPSASYFIAVSTEFYTLTM